MIPFECDVTPPTAEIGAKFEIWAKISIADRECAPMEQHRLPLALDTDIIC